MSPNFDMLVENNYQYTPRNNTLCVIPKYKTVDTVCILEPVSNLVVITTKTKTI